MTMKQPLWNAPPAQLFYSLAGSKKYRLLSVAILCCFLLPVFNSFSAQSPPGTVVCGGAVAIVFYLHGGLSCHPLSDFCLLVASRNERHRSTKKLPCKMRGCSPSVLRTTQFWRLRWMSALALKHLLIVFKNRPAKSPQNYQIKKWVKPYKVRRSQARALLSSPAHFTKF